MVKWITKILIALLIALVVGFIIFLFVPQNYNEVLIKDLIAEQSFDVSDPDLGIVLGAGIKADGSISDIGRERVDYAIELVDQSDLPLLFSGGETPFGIEALVMYTYAETHGYTGPDHIEASSTSTEENAKFSDRLLDEASFASDKVLLITSPYHSKRALATFRSVMPEREIEIAYPSKTVLLEDSVSGRIRGLRSILREYLATWFYELTLDIEIE